MDDALAPAPDVAAYRFRLNFFKLVVRDVDAMAAFYRTTFGFEERRRIELPGLVEVMLALPGETFTLVLYQHSDGREITIGNGHGPVGLLTSDLDGARNHALASGATAGAGPHDLPGMRLAFLLDPEGHEIELIELKRPPAAGAPS